MTTTSLSIPELIQKKRDKIPLTAAEIKQLVMGAATDTVPDYQLSAFLMATFFTGMTADETAALTRAMIDSGEHYDLSKMKGAKVDKHSTGGIGGTTRSSLRIKSADDGGPWPWTHGWYD
jgi:pyrimidine-nucleoside phosphorylase